MGHRYHVSPPKRRDSFEEKGEERVEESVVVDELKETMISGHNTEVAQKAS